MEGTMETPMTRSQFGELMQAQFVRDGLPPVTEAALDTDFLVAQAEEERAAYLR